MSMQFFICGMQFSIAGSSVLFKIGEYIKSPRQELKYDLFIVTDVPASGSMFTGWKPVPEAADEQLGLQSTDDLWRRVSEHADITPVCSASFLPDQLYYRSIVHKQ